MLLCLKQSTILTVIVGLALTLGGCQNIQIAESPIPVTADFVAAANFSTAK